MQISYQNKKKKLRADQTPDEQMEIIWKDNQIT
jgi:hypothetical protein